MSQKSMLSLGPAVDHWEMGLTPRCDRLYVVVRVHLILRFEAKPWKYCKARHMLKYIDNPCVRCSSDCGLPLVLLEAEILKLCF